MLPPTLEANQFVDAAIRTSKLACMVPKSLLANLHRTSAAIAFELGDTDRVSLEVEEIIRLYPECFPRPCADAVRTWRCGCPTAGSMPISSLWKAIYGSTKCAAIMDNLPSHPRFPVQGGPNGGRATLK